jgi:hypothetical protein
VWAGKLLICIDQFESADQVTRDRIATSLGSLPHTKIVVATQTTEGLSILRNTRRYRLLPLHNDDAIRGFLEGREHIMPAEAPIRGKAYLDACARFLSESLATIQSSTTVNEWRFILTNPRSATRVAMALGRGQRPTLSDTEQLPLNETD